MTQRCQRIARQVLRHDPMSTDVVLLVTVFPRRIIVRQRQQRRCTTRGICHGDEVERIVAQILERVQRAQLLLGMIVSERSLSYIPEEVGHVGEVLTTVARTRQVLQPVQRALFALSVGRFNVADEHGHQVRHLVHEIVRVVWLSGKVRQNGDA